jgi:hypothetical protein
MMSGSGVVDIFSVKNSNSVVVVVVRPSQVSSSSGKLANNFPAKISGAAQRTSARSSYNVSTLALSLSHLVKIMFSNLVFSLYDN